MIYDRVQLKRVLVSASQFNEIADSAAARVEDCGRSVGHGAYLVLPGNCESAGRGFSQGRRE